MLATGTHVTTNTGHEVDFLHPDPDEINFRTIAENLSTLPRWQGASYPYSVMDHSLSVRDWLVERGVTNGEVLRWALLHDAHEAYTGDIPAPLKTAIYRVVGWDVLPQIERKLDHAICKAGRIPFPTRDTLEKVDEADKAVAVIEREIIVDGRGFNAGYAYPALAADTWINDLSYLGLTL